MDTKNKPTCISRSLAGVTLIELLVVILIAGLLAALALPSFRKMLYNTNLKMAAGNMRSQLQLARSRAIADVNRHCGVYFDKDNGEYFVFLDTNSNDLHDAQEPRYGEIHRLPRGIRFADFDLGGETDIFTFNSALVFRGDGSAKAGKGQNVRIEHESGTMTRTINVLPSTGRIRVNQP